MHHLFGKHHLRRNLQHFDIKVDVCKICSRDLVWLNLCSCNRDESQVIFLPVAVMGMGTCCWNSWWIS